MMNNNWIQTAEHHQVIDSTSNRAKEILRQNPIPALPMLIDADSQTAARGRDNHSWWSGSGGIFLTLILDAVPHHLERSHVPQLSLGIGLAVLKTLRRHSPEQTFHIKWPNDVYLNNRKIAGILIESPSPQHFVIGVGINTNNTVCDAPAEIREKITTLRDVLHREIDNHRVTGDFITEVQRILAFFPNHTETLVQQVEPHLLMRHQPVSLTIGGQTVTGTCLGLAPNASLRILTDTGERTFLSGVISYRT
ncbi:MAG: biotin--[acetyl-CoA-carboxylase] ligase [Planctomycetaceae bacterium]|jgi:BirA family biotin operon repressor/biotin-[acetyl-CoA-carboxylase] ligase|nr:biotin--[acetyl-CoA-carboxylase] ligase [Planctomycetaceae bacterium]